MNLEKIQLDRRFLAEKGNHEANQLRFGVDCLNRTDEIRKRVGNNTDVFADFDIQLKLHTFNAHCRDLLIGEGNRLASRAYKAGNAAGVANNIPCVVVHDHFDHDITGVHLAKHRLGLL